MPILNPEQATASLNRMFLALPLPSANSDPEEALRMYLEQCSGYSNADIDLAVKQFLSGSVNGVSAGWAPTTAQFAQQLRSNLDYRASSVQSHNRLLQQFKEQEVDEEWEMKRTPEAKARVQALMDQIKQKSSGRTPEEVAEIREALRKTDQHFASDYIETESGIPVSRSLLQSISTYNSADDDALDMGDLR